MRNVFSALMKVMGFWMGAMGFSCLVQMLNSINFAIEPPPLDYPLSMIFYMRSVGMHLISVGFYFVVAWMLIFKTDWVADKVKVSKDEPLCESLGRSSLFSMGIQLLGIYTLVTAISSSILFITRESSLSGAFIAGLPWIVQICLSVICILKVDALVRFIADKTNAKWLKVLAFVLLALLVFIVLARIAVRSILD